MRHLYVMLIISFIVQSIGCYYFRKYIPKFEDIDLLNKSKWIFRTMVIGVIIQLFIIVAVATNYYLFNSSV